MKLVVVAASGRDGRRPPARPAAEGDGEAPGARHDRHRASTTSCRGASSPSSPATSRSIADRVRAHEGDGRPVGRCPTLTFSPAGEGAPPSLARRIARRTTRPSRRVAERHGFAVAEREATSRRAFRERPELFAADGFHPSAARLQALGGRDVAGRRAGARAARPGAPAPPAIGAVTARGAVGASLRRHDRRGPPRSATAACGGGPPAPLAPVHADAGVARRGAARRRRGARASTSSTRSGTATSTGSRRSGATSTATACRRSTRPSARSSSGSPTRRCSASPRPPRSSAPRSSPPLAPHGLTRVFFSDAGATAVEIALKMAFQHHQLRGDTARTEFVALRGAYHGDTIGSVSLGGIDSSTGSSSRSSSTCTTRRSRTATAARSGSAGRRARMACADEVEELFEARPGKIAALVLEPLVQGADGMIAQPPGLRPADARDLRPARRAARLRRGGDRLRPHRARCSRSSTRASSRTS